MQGWLGSSGKGDRREGQGQPIEATKLSNPADHYSLVLILWVQMILPGTAFCMVQRTMEIWPGKWKTLGHSWLFHGFFLLKIMAQDGR